MLNYIIATYAGNYWEFTLQLQLQVLYTLVMKGDLKHLSQVTIVCPKVKEGQFEHPLYYQKDLWLDLFSKSKVKLVYLDYKGENTTASYDQWIQAYLAYPDFEYFLFMEDDYTVHPSLTNFDVVLVDYYNASVDAQGGVGYLCTLASSLNNIPHHAAISNGIVNKKTMQKLGEGILDDFYKLASKCVGKSQYAFSLLFEHKGVNILSTHHHFAAWYWSTVRNYLEIYSDKSVTSVMFVPVQYFLRPHFNTHYIYEYQSEERRREIDAQLKRQIAI